MGKIHLKKYSFLHVYMWKNLCDLNVGESFKKILLILVYFRI